MQGSRPQPHVNWIVCNLKGVCVILPVKRIVDPFVWYNLASSLLGLIFLMSYLGFFSLSQDAFAYLLIQSTYILKNSFHPYIGICT